MINLIKLFKRKRQDPEAVSDSSLLKEKYICFQRLLAENNSILEIMADMEEKLSGEYLFDMAYVRSKCEELAGRTKSLIDNLCAVANGRYKELYQVFENIEAEIRALVEKKKSIPVSSLALPLAEITRDMVDIVGGKTANLGEIRNRINVPVPEGFAVSTYAYKTLIDYNEFQGKINEALASIDLNDIRAVAESSSKIQGYFLSARIPPDLESAMSNALQSLIDRCSSRKIRLSVRSSAVFEDGESTFAGQYATMLNVAPEDLIPNYLHVIASLFSPRAIFYCKNRGFSEEDLAMSVGVFTMIDAKTSGVLYTDGLDGARDKLTVNAVWGLGKYAVDGNVIPQTYVLSKDGSGNGKTVRDVGMQKVMLQCGPDGLVENSVPSELLSRSCLTDDQLGAMRKYAVSIADHYGRPQDIEWALDEDDRLFILQSRPLRIAASNGPDLKYDMLPKDRIIIEKGDIACRGVGFGKAYVVRTDEDLDAFPPGAVLIARHTSPKFVTVMDKAAAIVTDIGSATGHMASLAREFQVPTILNTEIATQKVQSGSDITVDAVNGNVYEGIVEVLRNAYKKEPLFKDTPIMKLLADVAKRSVPLNLVDPEAENFGPEFCRTYHDITRFAHEAAVNEMFGITDEIDGKQSLRLAAQMPLRIFVIDLGGGLKQVSGRNTAWIDDVSSIPLNAFLRGTRSIPWPEPRGVDARGLLSAIAGAPLQIPEGRGRDDELWDRSFCVISRQYMNFAMRLGFHLSTIEAYLDENLNSNYIHFFFKGGAAGFDRISRRVKLIASILESMDFKVKCSNDVLSAKLLKYKMPDMERKLEDLGRLTVFTKSLDMALSSETAMVHYVKDFLSVHPSSPEQSRI
ncbi:MAG: PEP/pyruvate-binding domain-containing protein [Pseudomonadota bacterium]